MAKRTLLEAILDAQIQGIITEAITVGPFSEIHSRIQEATKEIQDNLAHELRDFFAHEIMRMESEEKGSVAPTAYDLFHRVFKDIPAVSSSPEEQIRHRRHCEDFPCCGHQIGECPVGPSKNCPDCGRSFEPTSQNEIYCLPCGSRPTPRKPKRELVTNFCACENCFAHEIRHQRRWGSRSGYPVAEATERFAGEEYLCKPCADEYECEWLMDQEPDDY